MISKEVFQSALNSLQAACAKREYCVSDIRKKALKLCEGAEEDAEALVSSLVEDGFLSDERYAEAYAREKAALDAWGPHKIRTALRVKGIDRETIEAALAAVDTDRAAERLRRLLEAKWKTLCDDPYGRFKLLRYALSRGYDYDTIRPLCDEITQTP